MSIHVISAKKEVGTLTITPQGHYGRYIVEQKIANPLLQRITALFLTLFFWLPITVCSLTLIGRVSLQSSYSRIFKYQKYSAEIDLDFLKNQKILSGAFKNNEKVQDTLKKDYEFIKNAALYAGWVIKYADSSLQYDDELIRLLLNKDGLNLPFVPEKYSEDLTFAEIATQQNPMALEHAPAFQNIFDFVKKCVTKKGSSIRFASSDLKKNRELAIEAGANEPSSIQYIDPELLKEKTPFALDLVSREPWCLKYLDSKLKNDEDVVRAAVSKSPNSLVNASKELREKRKFIVDLIEVEPRILQYADSIIQNNYKIALSAARKDIQAIRNVDKDLRHRIEKVLAKEKGLATPKSSRPSTPKPPSMLKQNFPAYDTPFSHKKGKPSLLLDSTTPPHTPPPIQLDFDEIITEEKEVVIISSEFNAEKKADSNYVLNRVSLNGLDIQHADPKLKKVSKIGVAAVTQNSEALDLLDPILLEDWDVVAATLKHDKRDIILKLLSKSRRAFYQLTDVQKQDPEFTIEAAKCNLMILSNMDPKLKNSPEFFKELLPILPAALEYAGDAVIDDETCVKLAVEKDPYLLKFGSQRLRNELKAFAKLHAKAT